MSIYEPQLRAIKALPSPTRAAAFLRLEDPTFVQVVRLYFARRFERRFARFEDLTILPCNTNPQFYRDMLALPSEFWNRTLRAESQKEIDAWRLEDLVDPISLELPVEPVMTVYGRVYDKAGIQAWLAAHDTDPCTREHLHHLYPIDANRLITCKEPATEEEFEKKTAWNAKRAQLLFDRGKHMEAVKHFKHPPSVRVVLDQIYSHLEEQDNPDEELFVDYGTSEGIALEALTMGMTETANMCLGMMEMMCKERPDFARAVYYLSKVDSLPSDLLQFCAWTRGDDLNSAAHVAQKIVAQHPVPDWRTQGPFQFLADCASDGTHGVPCDEVLASCLTGRLADANLLFTRWGVSPTDIHEGIRRIRTYFSCAGEAHELLAQNLLAQINSALSEYAEARHAEKRTRY